MWLENHLKETLNIAQPYQVYLQLFLQTPYNLEFVFLVDLPDASHF